MELTLGMLTLGAATWLVGLLSVAFLFCSVLLILTVLIQRPQGGGLSGAFGAGAGSGETAFGARTGDALTIATISFFVIWLIVATGLVLVMQPQLAPSGTQAASTDTTTTPEPLPDEQPEAPIGEQPPGEPGAQPADQPGEDIPAPAEGAGDAGGGETDGPANDGGG